MKPVREIVSRDIIDDLWGAGYTILPRNRHPDPFFVPQEMVPQGRFYQWWHLIHDKIHFDRPAGATPSGWAPVPASRHDGYFMPAGFVGDIEVNGLGLFEKAKFEVDAERAGNVAAAQKQVDDWVSRTGTQFLGEISINGDKAAVGATKTFESLTNIPKDMIPHLVQIFEERDRLTQEHVEAEREGIKGPFSDAFDAAIEAQPNLAKWPTLNAIVLPHAIKNVRKRITEEATNGKTS